MKTLRPGEVATELLRAGKQLSVNAAGGSAIIERFRSGKLIDDMLIGSFEYFGPYENDYSFKITCTRRAVSIEKLDSHQTSAFNDVDAVVDYIDSVNLIKFEDFSIPGESPLATAADVIASFDAVFNDVDYAFGHVTKVILPGTTILGNSLYAYEFSPTFYKKTIIVLAGLHGTEINTHSPLRKFCEHFIGHPELYPDLSETRVVVAPMLNPDGFRLTRGNGNTPPVDINRNFLIGGDYPNSWSDFSISGDFYKGLSAFSEIESQAIRWLFETRYHDVSCMIDLHNLGDNIDANFSALQMHSLSHNPSSAVANVLNNVVGGDDVWYIEDSTSTPNPTTITYAQQRSIWSVGLEIGIAKTDTETNGGMTNAVRVLANTLYALNALQHRDTKINESAYALSIQRHHINLTIPTSASYARLDSMSISYTPKLDAKLLGIYSGVIAPGDDNLSTVYIAPEVYQGADDATFAIEEQSILQGNGSVSRRPFWGEFSRDIVAGVPINFGIKTKTSHESGSKRLARLGMIGILLPAKFDYSPTLLSDHESMLVEVLNFNYTGKNIILNNNSTYADIPELEQLVHTKVSGILIIQIEVKVDSGDSGILYISSASGNDLALISDENNTDQRSRNERYINQTGRKEIIKSFLIQQCLPSSVRSEALSKGTQKHKIGLRTKISSGGGQCTLTGYRLRAHFIPAALGHDQMEWHLHDAGVMTKIF